MATDNKKEFSIEGEIVNEDTHKNKEDENTESQALLAPRYLLPALMDGDADTDWSLRNIAAIAAVVVILAGLVALYIHGASVTAAV